MKYSIDTSSLINSWHKYYPRDLFPTFWKDFESLCDSQEIVASEVVLKELEEKEKDQLFTWCKSKKCFAMPLDDDLQDKVKFVLEKCPELVNVRRNRSGADPFVIALAMNYSLIVVSEELPTKKATNETKIPDACSTLGLRHESITGLIRNEGWKY